MGLVGTGGGGAGEKDDAVAFDDAAEKPERRQMDMSDHRTPMVGRWQEPKLRQSVAGFVFSRAL